MVEISICICTFRRPQGLRRLLHSIQDLDVSTPAHEVIVVDNEARGTAEPIVRETRAEGLKVHYLVEPIQNVARARTRSVQAAQGEFIAFIDDDEEAAPDWLVTLWREVVARGVDGGFGPVIPRFAPATPTWVREGEFLATPRHPTGTILPWFDTRTSNALIRRRPLMALPALFDETYGRIGGEDCELFSRMIENGARFIAVDSAVVYHDIPRSRARMRWLLSAHLIQGIVYARLRCPSTSWRGWLVRTAKALYLAVRYWTRGLLVFPRSRTRGFRLMLDGTHRLGQVAFFAGVSVRKYESPAGVTKVRVVWQ